MYIPLKTFKAYCQQVIPLIYEDSLSYYEVLCKLMEYINNIIDNTDYLNQQTTANSNDIAALKKDVAYINNQLENIANGAYLNVYINGLIDWIDQNIQQLIGRMVKYITFGLTPDGYFCAWIPQTWDFITFSTGMIPDQPDYGCLILNY